MSNILSAIAAAGQLFGGAGSSVTLGPVTFAEIETPERIPVGGEQALTVFKMPGGKRIVQAMGRDDADMMWSGYLEGPGAESRMLLLDSLRQSGTEIQLAFGQSTYQVVVKSFSADYERVNWIPYRIGVLVVEDNAASFGSQPPSLLDDLNSDLNNAAGFNVGSAAETAMTTAQTALNVTGALGFGGASWASALADVTTAQNLISVEQEANSSTIGGIVALAGTVGNILGVSQVANAAGVLGTVVSASDGLAASTQAGAYLTRAYKNLQTASA